MSKEEVNRCYKCNYFRMLKGGFSYCNKLKHRMDNGYAMQCHQKKCGGLKCQKKK